MSHKISHQLRYESLCMAFSKGGGTMCLALHDRDPVSALQLGTQTSRNAVRDRVGSYRLCDGNPRGWVAYINCIIPSMMESSWFPCAVRD